MKRLFFRIILPWAITVVALYFAFRDVEWSLLLTHLSSANPLWVLAAVLLTGLSYVLRSFRWPLLFPATKLKFFDSYRVLVLGFFMNNVLPARAGEFVRAHLGGKVTGQQRTLVLATVASERLADGLTLSLMFAIIIMLLGAGPLDPEYAKNLSRVADLFVIIAAGVLVVLTFRKRFFALLDKIQARLNHKASSYTLSRLQIFVDGLSPLSSKTRAPAIAAWSIVIWLLELTIYCFCTYVFGVKLPLAAMVLFLVAVNFSSLVPAAPGGFGVIELVAKKVLMSVGVQSDELALCIVLTQHVIQYLVVGVQGGIFLATWSGSLKEIQEVEHELETGEAEAVS